MIINRRIMVRESESIKQGNYMKTLEKVKKGICYLLTMLMIGMLCTGCMSDDDFWEDDDYEDYEYEDYEYEDSVGQGETVPVSTDRVTASNSLLSVDGETGTMTITRPKRDTETPMGESGTWTIFVYLCGSDLESDDGMASDDIMEMLSSSAGGNVRFVVETGGSGSWNDPNVDRSMLQRFVIEYQAMTEVYSEASRNMGDTAVLTDFLRWGIRNYPAEHMGVIFWNHGSGSINGVCFDELNNDDSLSLLEIDSALYSIYDEMTDRFEFVGFDACLMGTVETANVLASYARYMYGSEETEPGSGWNYTEIGNYLAENPNANGEELGKVVCDSFLADCKAQNDDDLTTLSVIDLNKVDDLLIAFHSFAKSMYDAGADADTLASMIRGIEAADNFGGNNRSEGYTNMVDMGGLIQACSSYTNGASEAAAALERSICYQVTGATHRGASGLAIYYPLELQGSSELSIFETVSVSPYYLSFIDRQDLGSIYASDDSYYDNSYDDDYDDDDDSDYGDSYDDSLPDFLWYDDDDWYDDSYWYDDDNCWNSYCDYEYDDSCDCYRRKSADTDHWKYADQFKPTGESRLITFAQKPALNADGIYTFTLDKRGLENAAAVYAYVYEVSGDGKELIEIGETFDVIGDWSDGVFEDMFDGYWLSLPDGQNLATYIVDYDEDAIIYTSPILLNGQETNLRLRQDNDGTVTIEGAWDGIDENGAASKKITKLKDGDVIIPCYYSLDMDTFEDLEGWQGAEYKVNGTPEILLGMLDEADYYYAFCIDDIYHDYYMTEFEEFHVDEHGDTWFYTE